MHTIARVALDPMIRIVSANTRLAAHVSRMAAAAFLLVSFTGCPFFLPPLPQGSSEFTVQVLAEYPHDRAAFTQGLVMDNGALFEGTGLFGQSTLRRVDLETGTVLQQINLANEFFGEGVTVLGDRIIQLTWLSNTGFVYDRTTFDLLDTFMYSTEGWGITHDGTRLIMSDGTSTIRFLDPQTFENIGSINVVDMNGPVIRLNELEYIAGEIWANVWLTDFIVVINPATGDVTASIDLTGLLSPEDLTEPVDVLNGIAYDAQNDRIFVTGKLWPKLFEIELVPIP